MRNCHNRDDNAVGQAAAAHGMNDDDGSNDVDDDAGSVFGNNDQNDVAAGESGSDGDPNKNADGQG